MTHDEELILGARLRELRRDLLALALLDPAGRAALDRIADDVAARRMRIEAVVDEPELTPAEARQQFDVFRSAVARLPTESRDDVASPAIPASCAGNPLPVGVAQRALDASRELASSIALQWGSTDRVLQSSWVHGTGSRSAPAPAATPPAQLQPGRPSLPPALAERARRSREEIDSIFERFVAQNQGLVANVVRHYRGLGLSQEDLMQDGNIGLLRAVEKFDERRGKPFGSYAVWWVRESVRRALAHHGRTIRLPAHAIAKRYAIGQASRRLAHELGRDPSAHELSSAIGMAPESIDDVMRLSKEPLSLDAPRADDTEITLGDVIADRRSESPTERASTRESVGHLQALLADLTARERRVLSLRFGLDGGEEQTLEEIGRSLDLTRERVRQIVAAALDKLNRATRARRLDL